MREARKLGKARFGTELKMEIVIVIVIVIEVEVEMAVKGSCCWGGPIVRVVVGYHVPNRQAECSSLGFCGDRREHVMGLLVVLPHLVLPEGACGHWWFFVRGVTAHAGDQSLAWVMSIFLPLMGTCCCC